MMQGAALDWAILMHWVEFAVRWTHVITAIAWIGSSFYFIALDLGLNRKIPGPADGEEWQVHGGGFYHIQKYMVAPEAMPEHLTWFKWESYATWLSGAALLIVLYWAGRRALPHRPHPSPIWPPGRPSPSPAARWCLAGSSTTRSANRPWARHPRSSCSSSLPSSWRCPGATRRCFRAAPRSCILGAFTATIMSANVFLIIIPNQKIVVADLKTGRTPDAKYGKIAKLRSTHNNYLTLPVIFLMLSNHYPLAFASEFNWLIASLVFLMGVTIRHFFNTMHMKGPMLWWTWVATSVIFIGIIWLSALGLPEEEEAAMGPAAARFAAHEDFPEVANIVLGRCSMCHGQFVSWPGIVSAPGGVHLDSDAAIANHAREIYLQSGVSRAMPPGNLTDLSDADRAAIRAWYRAVTGGET